MDKLTAKELYEAETGDKRISDQMAESHERERRYKRWLENKVEEQRATIRAIEIIFNQKY